MTDQQDPTADRPIDVALTSGLANCARCGGTHPRKLKWKAFLNPPTIEAGNGVQAGTYQYWARCPTTGDPILLWVAQDDADTDR